MEQSNQSEFKRDILIYFSIICMTALIIGIHALNLHLIGIFLTVAVAATEACILAYFFMHLTVKRRTIHLLLLMTIVFFLGLLFWPAWDVGYSPRTISEYVTN
jgi:hypothetical protein